MPAVSKGDGMRGLAVFISDIRNCECAAAWAGARRPERGRGGGRRCGPGRTWVRGGLDAGRRSRGGAAGLGVHLAGVVRAAGPRLGPCVQRRP